MIDKNKKVYVCERGHVQHHKGGCVVCGSKDIKEHPQVVIKGDKV